MNLLDVFPEPHLLVNLEARDKTNAIHELIQHLVSSGSVDEDTGKKIEKAVNKREAEGSTGIGKGLAIPHSKECDAVDSVIGVMGRSTDGIEYNSIDGGAVHVLFLVVSPESQADQHLKIMKKIASLHRDEKTIKFFSSTDRLNSVKEIFKEIDDSM